MKWAAIPSFNEEIYSIHLWQYIYSTIVRWVAISSLHEVGGHPSLNGKDDHLLYFGTRRIYRRSGTGQGMLLDAVGRLGCGVLHLGGIAIGRS